MSSLRGAGHGYAPPTVPGMTTPTVPAKVPGPFRHGRRRPNPLRVTGSLRAIAAAMNGLDPDPADLAELGGVRVSVETLHQAAAVALRQKLLSAPREQGSVIRDSLLDPAQRVPLGAYYLAVSLAESRDALPGCAERSGLEGAEFVAAAGLISAMQSRFLAAVCSQVTLASEEVDVDIPSSVTAATVLARGGELTPGIALRAAHTSDPSEWLFATSTVTVAGFTSEVVVDAGPPSLPAAVSARLAAPVQVAPDTGIWPESVVFDCLRIAAPAVQSWVADMARELGGDDTGLVLTPGTALRQFLVSPAAVALTGAQLKSGDLPLRPAAPARLLTERAAVMAEMRNGGIPGMLLRPDTVLDAALHLPRLGRDEEALLATLPVADLGGEVEVTVDFEVPEWEDVTDLLGGIRAAGGLTLTSPVVGRVDSEPAPGRLRRVGLQARVRHGVVCQTRDGFAVLIPAGTQLSLAGIGKRRSQSVVYAAQAADPADPGLPGAAAPAESAA